MITFQSGCAFARLVTAAACLTGATIPAARADLTLNGAVGLPHNPTALIPDEKGARLEAGYYGVGEVRTDAGRESDLRFSGIHGALRAGSAPLELSGGYERLDAGGDDLNGNGIRESGVALGAKYRFWQDRNELPSWMAAAGIGYSRVLAENVYGYLVATRVFGARNTDRTPILAHLGLRYDRFNFGELDSIDLNSGVPATGANRSQKISLYSGLEVPLDREAAWTFVGELQTPNAEYRRGDLGGASAGGASAGGARWPFVAALRYRAQNKRFSATAGIQRRGYTGLSGGATLFLQTGYSFGDNS